MSKYAKLVNIEKDQDFCEAKTCDSLCDNKPDSSELTKQNSLTFVTTGGVMQLIQEKCEEVNEILCMQNDEVLIILNHYQWRKDFIGEDWIQNEDKLCKEIGLEPKQIIELEDFGEMQCPGCFVSKPKEEFDSLKCNHLMCKVCWADYVQYNITQFDKPFFWKCIIDGCNMVAPHSFNQKYIIDEARPQYEKKMAMTYTNTSKSFRWCPIVNCQYGVDVVDSIAQAIECKCGWVYCFKCGQEDHRPCTCGVAEEWIKNGESKDTLLYKKWLLANTKDCPKCKKPIEKNLGCNRMKCLNVGCGYEFCWQCLDNWDNHIGIDLYSCGKYAIMDQKLKKEMNEIENEHKKNLAQSCAYYEHYKRCEEKLEKIGKLTETIKLENERIKASNVSEDIDFLVITCQTLESTQRLTKWSYAYEFYMNNEVCNEGQDTVCKILQEKLENHSGHLQEKLQELCSKKAGYLDYVKSQDAIQPLELTCKMISARFLEKMGEIEDKQVIESQISKIALDKVDDRAHEKIIEFHGNAIEYEKKIFQRKEEQRRNKNKASLNQQRPNTIVFKILGFIAVIIILIALIVLFKS